MLTAKSGLALLFLVPQCVALKLNEFPLDDATANQIPGLPTELLKQEMDDLGLEPSPALTHYLTQEKSNFEMRPSGDMLPKHKPTVWIHIHKAGGTFMCACAHINNERLPIPSGNCNGNDDGGSGGLYHGKRLSCAERVARNSSWHQSERVTVNPWCFDDFDYAIWLRDPVSLAASEANQKHPNKKIQEYYQDNLACSAGGDCPKVVYRSGSDTIPLWMYFDNYAVRALLGADVYNLPPGGVTEEHAKQALELLSHFRVRVVMEKVIKEERYRKFFMDELDWKQWPAETKSNKNERIIRPIEFSETEKEQIRKQNKWDYMLYDHVMKEMEAY